MRYNDCNYGEVELPKEIDIFLNSPPMQRLKDINLSTISRYYSYHNIDSRFTHSVGAFHLSQFVPSELNTLEMRLAVLFHDIGALPFTHISDEVFHEITGDHETRAGEIITSNFLDVLNEMGASSQKIADYILGKHPLGALVNGAIDLDNIDNFLRWSRGVNLFKSPPHDPILMVKSITMKNGKISYDCPEQIEKWSRLRYEVYNWIYDNENIITSGMLHIALQAALECGKVDEEFFSMTEGEAIVFLRKIPGASEIIQMLDNGELFLRVFDRKSEEKQDLEVCEYMNQNFPKSDFYVHSFQSRDVKEGINPELKRHHRTIVFVHPRYKAKAREIGERLKQL